LLFGLFYLPGPFFSRKAFNAARYGSKRFRLLALTRTINSAKALRELAQQR